MTNVDEFLNLYQNENESMFEQGLWLVNNITDKKSETEIKRACGLASGASAETIHKRYKVGKVFGDEWFQDCNWTLHLAAIDIAHVDIKKPETYKAAHDLMNTAIKGYVDSDGHHRPHSAATLKASVAGNRAGEKPEVVYRGEARVKSLEWSHTLSGLKAAQNVLTLLLMDYGDFAEGEALQITITRNPQPATAPAVETEANAA